MRLIDADTLKENISHCRLEAANEFFERGATEALEFYVPNIIDDAPTIDAEPVRRGVWKPEARALTFDGNCQASWLKFRNTSKRSLKSCRTHV